MPGTLTGNTESSTTDCHGPEEWVKTLLATLPTDFEFSWAPWTITFSRQFHCQGLCAPPQHHETPGRRACPEWQRAVWCLARGEKLGRHLYRVGTQQSVQERQQRKELTEALVQLPSWCYPLAREDDGRLGNTGRQHGVWGMWVIMVMKVEIDEM
jgi:hypothetical protein